MSNFERWGFLTLLRPCKLKISPVKSMPVAKLKSAIIVLVESWAMLHSKLRQLRPQNKSTNLVRQTKLNN
jgi:hypothetical protein